MPGLGIVATGFAPEFGNARQGKTMGICRFLKNATSEKHGAMATLAQISGKNAFCMPCQFDSLNLLGRQMVC
jgi:hypothetical protein